MVKERHREWEIDFNMIREMKAGREKNERKEREEERESNIVRTINEIV